MPRTVRASRPPFGVDAWVQQAARPGLQSAPREPGQPGANSIRDAWVSLVTPSWYWNLDVNYEFHLDEWLPRFPLREEYGHYSGDDITSPCDICNIEWLRRGMLDQYDWGQPVPVDVFVMSRGEPENRYAT